MAEDGNCTTFVPSLWDQNTCKKCFAKKNNHGEKSNKELATPKPQSEDMGSLLASPNLFHARMQEDLKKKGEECEKLKRQLEALQGNSLSVGSSQQATQLQKELNFERQEKEKHGKQMEAMEKKMDILAEKIKTVEVEVQMLGNENALLDDALSVKVYSASPEKAKKHLEALENRITELDGVIKHSLKEQRNLEETIASLEEENRLLDQALKTQIKANKENIPTDDSDLSKILESMEQKIAEKEEEIKALSKENESLRIRGSSKSMAKKTLMNRFKFGAGRKQSLFITCKEPGCSRPRAGLGKDICQKHLTGGSNPNLDLYENDSSDSDGQSIRDMKPRMQIDRVPNTHKKTNSLLAPIGFGDDEDQADRLTTSWAENLGMASPLIQLKSLDRSMLMQTPKYGEGDKVMVQRSNGKWVPAEITTVDTDDQYYNCRYDDGGSEKKIDFADWNSIKLVKKALKYGSGLSLPNSSGASGGQGRGDLLAEIQKGKKLHRTGKKSPSKSTKHVKRKTDKKKKKFEKANYNDVKSDLLKKEVEYEVSETGFKNPKEKLSTALQQVTNGKWKEEFAALDDLRTIAVHHPQVLSKRLRDVMDKLEVQLNNLRSSIVKNCILCLRSIFINLGPSGQCDKYVHPLTPLLLKYAADNNAFVADEGEETLRIMVDNVTKKIAVKVLLNLTDDKNADVKAKASKYTLQVAENMGASLFSKKIIEMFIKMIPPLLYANNAEARQHSMAIVTCIGKTVTFSGPSAEKELKSLIDRQVPRKFRERFDKALAKGREEGEKALEEDPSRKIQPKLKKKNSKRKKKKR